MPAPSASMRPVAGSGIATTRKPFVSLSVSILTASETMMPLPIIAVMTSATHLEICRIIYYFLDIPRIIGAVLPHYTVETFEIGGSGPTVGPKKAQFHLCSLPLPAPTASANSAIDT